ALPAMPTTLTSGVGVLADDILYVAGPDASGAPHLFQLALMSEVRQWGPLAAWPGGGVPTSIVSRLGSLYFTVRSEGDAADRLLRWSPQKGWQDRGTAPGAVAPG